jgi:hypothetical protein
LLVKSRFARLAGEYRSATSAADHAVHLRFEPLTPAVDEHQQLPTSREAKWLLHPLVVV